jgi:hypothetical protein
VDAPYIVAGVCINGIGRVIVLFKRPESEGALTAVKNADRHFELSAKKAAGVQRDAQAI